MTQTEFENQKFGAGDTAIYKGQKYKVASVDFEEMLIGLFIEDADEDSNISWVRCENVIYQPFNP